MGVSLLLLPGARVGALLAAAAAAAYASWEAAASLLARLAASHPRLAGAASRAARFSLLARLAAGSSAVRLLARGEGEAAARLCRVGFGYVCRVLRSARLASLIVHEGEAWVTVLGSAGGVPVSLPASAAADLLEGLSRGLGRGLPVVAWPGSEGYAPRELLVPLPLLAFTTTPELLALLGAEGLLALAPKPPSGDLPPLARLSWRLALLAESLTGEAEARGVLGALRGLAASGEAPRGLALLPESSSSSLPRLCGLAGEPPRSGLRVEPAPACTCRSDYWCPAKVDASRLEASSLVGVAATSMVAAGECCIDILEEAARRAGLDPSVVREVPVVRVSPPRGSCRTSGLHVAALMGASVVYPRGELVAPSLAAAVAGVDAETLVSHVEGLVAAGQLKVKRADAGEVVCADASNPRLEWPRSTSILRRADATAPCGPHCRSAAVSEGVPWDAPPLVAALGARLAVLEPRAPVEAVLEASALGGVEALLGWRHGACTSIDSATGGGEWRPIAAWSSVLDATGAAVRAAKSRLRVEPRPYQVTAISRIVASWTPVGLPSHTVVVLLPTGAGKSLVFQAAALAAHEAMGGYAVVVEPLLALIEDQVSKLRGSLGSRVCRVDGATPRAERARCIEAALRGEVALVYATPEKLEGEARRLLEEGPLNLIVLDEAHAAVRWGESFRPAYMTLLERIRELRGRSGLPPVLAVTATLTVDEEAKLMHLLGVERWREEPLPLTEPTPRVGAPDSPIVLRGPVLRSNLLLTGSTVEAKARLQKLTELVSELSEWAARSDRGWVGVVYTGFVRSTRSEENADFIADFLAKRGFKVRSFHGGLGGSVRRRVLEEARRVCEEGGSLVVVATKAFGMGVDVPCIRWVVHYMMPESPEEYYQEVGRAGRDGGASIAHLLYSPGYDESRRRSLIEKQMVRPKHLEALWRIISSVNGRMVAPVEVIAHAVVGAKSRLRGDALESAEAIAERALRLLEEHGVVRVDAGRGYLAPCSSGSPPPGSTQPLCPSDSPPPTPLRFTLGELVVEVAGPVRYVVVEATGLEPEWRSLMLAAARRAWLDYARLSAMSRIAAALASGASSEAAKLIERYFTFGVEEVASPTRSLAELKHLLDSVGVAVRRRGFKVRVEAPREARALGLAAAAAMVMLEERIPGTLAAIAAPRGLVAATRRELTRLEAKLRPPAPLAARVSSAKGVRLDSAAVLLDAVGVEANGRAVFRVELV